MEVFGLALALPARAILADLAQRIRSGTTPTLRYVIPLNRNMDVAAAFIDSSAINGESDRIKSIARGDPVPTRTKVEQGVTQG